MTRDKQHPDKNDQDVEGWVRAAYSSVRAPERLLLRIRETENTRTHRTRRFTKRYIPTSVPTSISTWAVPGIAVAMVFLVTWVLSPTLDLSHPTAESTADTSAMSLPEALTSEFATFIASGRDYDVTSTNAMTLRAWFTSRLNATPPPGPPIQSMLSLAGGRLCQIQRNRVVSYVYRLDGIPVSLYITEADTAIQATTPPPGSHQLTMSLQQEFSFVTWQQSGWQYSLVAEVPIQKLTKVATLMSSWLDEQQS